MGHLECTVSLLKAAPVFRVDRFRKGSSNPLLPIVSSNMYFLGNVVCYLVLKRKKTFHSFSLYFLTAMQEKEIFGTCTNGVLRFLEMRDDNSFVLLVITSVS